MNSHLKFNFKKKYGQHFLNNEDVAINIIKFLEFQTYKQVIEVGPGTGVLTKYIVKKCKPILIEIDEEAIEFLNKNVTNIQKIISGDFLKINLKNYLNVNLLKETQKDEDFQNLGGLGVLITGFASKIVDSILDTYVNSEGLSTLMQETQIARKLPKPDFNTLLGGIKIMEFKNHSSFRIKHIVNKQEIYLLFQRIGTDWKIIRIELPEDLLNEFKKI